MHSRSLKAHPTIKPTLGDLLPLFEYKNYDFYVVNGDLVYSEIVYNNKTTGAYYTLSMPEEVYEIFGEFYYKENQNFIKAKLNSNILTIKYAIANNLI